MEVGKADLAWTLKSSPASSLRAGNDEIGHALVKITEKEAAALKRKIMETIAEGADEEADEKGAP